MDRLKKLIRESLVAHLNEADSKKKDDVKEITEHDIDPFFIKKFKEQIRFVYEQEMEKKRLEDEQGDLLIIEL